MGDAASALELKTKYDEVTCRVVEVLKEAGPVTIIRFGSAAWGTLHEDSDLDLCVVVERTDERPIRHIELSLDRLLWDRYRPRDVEIQLHVYYRDTFEDYLRREDPFLHEVVKGEIVYEASQEAHEWLKESDAAFTSEEADAALAYAEAVLSFLSPRIEELLKKETE